MDNLQVLVLADNYTPIGRVSWQVAICDVLSGRAEVLEVYEGRLIHTVSEAFAIPSVIRFIKKVVNFFKRAVKFNRKNVWLRDRGHCQYCGHKVAMSEFTYDHVRPLAQGGRTTWTNIVVACMPCNQRKRDRTPEQAGMYLYTAPIVPKSLPGSSGFNSLGDPASMPREWADYLGSLQYWTEKLV